MATTRKLTGPGLSSLGANLPVTVNPSTGKADPVTLAALAKEVGALIGVQTAQYYVDSAGGWVRIAAIGCNAVTINFKNVYGNIPSKSCVLLVGTDYSNPGTVRMTGEPSVFDKARIVTKNGYSFLEVNAKSGRNQWDIQMLGPTSKNERLELYQSQTDGGIPEGYAAKEFTLAEMKNWGGVKVCPSVICAKKGGRHEHGEEGKRVPVHNGFGSEQVAGCQPDIRTAATDRRGKRLVEDDGLLFPLCHGLRRGHRPRPLHGGRHCQRKERTRRDEHRHGASGGIPEAWHPDSVPTGYKRCRADRAAGALRRFLEGLGKDYHIAGKGVAA